MKRNQKPVPMILWANYLSKGYFKEKWLGSRCNYIAKPLDSFNAFRIKIAQMPTIISPIMPF